MLFVFAREYVLIILGPQWTEAILPFQILVLGTVMRTNSGLSDTLVKAKGAVYSRAWRQAIYALCVVGGAAVGQRWGLTGVAAGVLVALMVNAAMMAQLSLKLTGMRWQMFAQIHVRALLLTGVVLAESWGAGDVFALLGLACATHRAHLRFGHRRERFSARLVLSEGNPGRGRSLDRTTYQQIFT